MSFLRSIRSDLLSKRLLPVFILLCVALVGAVAYLKLGGNSNASSTPTPPIVSTTSVGTLGSVSQAPENPNEAVAETTNGGRYQHQGKSRNPFKAVTSSTTTTATTTTSTTPTSSTPTTTTSTTPAPTSTTPSKSSEEKTTTAPAKKQKPAPVYTVNVMFGQVPDPSSGSPTPELKSYEGLKRLEPLPSSSDPLLVYTGVSPSGKGAIFTLVHEAILTGFAACLPSPSQCQMIDMAAGETEQLNFLSSSGQTVFYQLKVLSITKSEKSASTASVKNGLVSSAGRSLLKRIGPPALHLMRFSQSKGVLVYTRGG